MFAIREPRREATVEVASTDLEVEPRREARDLQDGKREDDHRAPWRAQLQTLGSEGEAVAG